MTTMWTGTYIGTGHPFLEGRRAALRWSETECGWLLVQFNDLELHLAYGWHSFPRGDFEFDPPDGGAP